jgi:hypothetical protein
MICKAASLKLKLGLTSRLSSSQFGILWETAGVPNVTSRRRNARNIQWCRSSARRVDTARPVDGKVSLKDCAMLT